MAKKEKTQAFPAYFPYLLIVIIISFGAGFLLGGPTIIDLTETQQDSIIASQERACEKQVRTIERDWEDKLKDCRDSTQRVALVNQECLRDNIKMQDNWLTVFSDLNQSISDLNFACDCNA
jgi:hypothetical protein